MMRRAFVFILCVLFGIPVGTAHAEIEFMKVVEIKGKADLYDPQSSQWAQLTSIPVQLRSGNRLRTHKDSSAEIVMDHKWDKMIHLGAGTRIQILDESLSRIALDEGLIYILCEDDRKHPTTFKVLSKDSRFEMGVAGIGLVSEVVGTRARVFADFITAFPKKDGKYRLSGSELQEGFQALIQADMADEPAAERMSFDDYWKWQAWIKARYAQKDKLHAKRARS